MTDLIELLRTFLIDEALIVVPALMILGIFLKNTPKIEDWTIPYVLLAIGLALTGAHLGFNIDGILQGILVTGAAVFGHQLIKQTKERR